jgi:hypothetical protein
MNWLRRGWMWLLLALLVLVAGASICIAFLASKVANHIDLPSYHYGDMSELGCDYVTVHGTLISTSKDGISSPLNTVKFSCDRTTAECSLLQAEVFDNSLLSISSETFDISLWDENFIVFKTKAGASECAEWSYRIDRLKKELIGKRSRPANYSYENCGGLGFSDFEIKVVDGWEVVKDLRGFD